jgi:Ca2+-binding RTX toxin-like protein
MTSFISPWPQPGGITHGSVMTFGFGMRITPGPGTITLLSDDASNTLLYAFTKDTLVFGDTSVSLTLPATLPYGKQYKLKLDHTIVMEAAAFPYGTVTTYIELEDRPAPAPVQWSGGAAPETFHGSNGVDLLQGGDGDDALYGHAGNDVVLGGASGTRGDILYGMDGNDALFGQDGTDALHGGHDNDYLDGGEGDDKLEGNDGDDELHGGNGNDALVAGGGTRDLLYGEDGYDSLYLWGGGGEAYGGSGQDYIGILGSSYAPVTARVVADGGDGNDYIHVQARPDAGGVVARGGGGTDTYSAFLFLGGKYTPTQITIADFVPGADGDVISVDGMIPDDYAGGNPFGTAGVLRLQQQGADTLLQVDRDGAGAAGYDNVMVLQGVQRTALTAANFGGLSPDGGRAGLTGDGIGPFTGTLADDILKGTPDHDHLAGLNGNDVLHGGEGNDEFKGGYGADTLYGGAGTDTARYDFDVDNPYTVATGAGGVVVADRRHPADIDRLDGVERILFTQDHRTTTGIALDVDGVGGNVFRLYLAAFGAQRDSETTRTEVGLALNQADHGVALDALARGIVTSSAFAQAYGAHPDSTALVTALYRNALHREPDVAGLQYWTGLLDSKAIDAGSLLASVAGSIEHRAIAATIIGSSFEYLAPFVQQW